MAKGSGGTSKYSVPTTRGNDNIDGSTLDEPLQARGLIINGGAGDDTLKGGSGADTLTGGDGNDYIYGDLSDLAGAGDGTAVWDGGKGTDTLDLSLLPYSSGLGTYLSLGTGGPSSSSRVWTNVYNPDGSIYGFDTAEAKYLNNAKGFENVVMGGGDDWVDIAAGLGNNRVDGGAGNDVLNAGDGNDTLLGGDGDDMINGSWGNDVMAGGAGKDMFLFLGRLAGQYTLDTISDFDIDASDGVTDSLWLGANYSVRWDANSSVLHGYLFDSGTAVGEITLLGLSYGDSAAVQVVYGVDYTTGLPLG